MARRDDLTLLQGLGFAGVRQVETYGELAPNYFAERSPADAAAIVTCEAAPPIGVRGIKMAFTLGVKRGESVAMKRGIDLWVIVLARSYGRRSREEFERFARIVTHQDESRAHRLPATRWIVSDGGTASPAIVREGVPSIEDAQRRGSPRFASRTARHPAATSLFSDGMLACAKAVLAEEIGIKLFRIASERERIAGSATTAAARIAARAPVALPQAYRFLRAYRDHELISVRDEEVRIADRRRLFDRWRDRLDAALRSGVRAGTRGSTIDEWLKRVPASAVSVEGTRVAIGAHSAAARFGVTAASGAPLMLYVEDPIHDAAERLGLDVEPRDEAQVFLVRAPLPRTIFEWVIPRGDGFRFPTTDLLQCYLDAGVHPARGADLAARLERKYPRLRAGDA